jgi:hypothetical protein
MNDDSLVIGIDYSVAVDVDALFSKYLDETYGCHSTGVAGSHQGDRSSRSLLLSIDWSLGVVIMASEPAALR